jgi:hypothetical protein
MVTGPSAQAAPQTCTDIAQGTFCLSKKVSPAMVRVGEQIEFTITEEWHDPGGRSLGHDDPITDTLPSGAGFQNVVVSHSVSSGAGSRDETTCTQPTPTTIECAGPREIPAERAYTITITATPTQPGSFRNIADEGRFFGTVDVPFTVVAAPSPPSASGSKHHHKKHPHKNHHHKKHKSGGGGISQR